MSVKDNPKNPDNRLKTTQSRPLTLKQKKFCELFATSEDFFGNGVQSYIEAFNIPSDKYKSALVGAHRLLIKANILAYINDIMTEIGFNELHADKQLGFLMTQNAEMGVKLGAIREFNALKQRIVKKLHVEGEISTHLVLGRKKRATGS